MTLPRTRSRSATATGTQHPAKDLPGVGTLHPDAKGTGLLPAPAIAPANPDKASPAADGSSSRAPAPDLHASPNPAGADAALDAAGDLAAEAFSNEAFASEELADGLPAAKLSHDGSPAAASVRPGLQFLAGDFLEDVPDVPDLVPEEMTDEFSYEITDIRTGFSPAPVRLTEPTDIRALPGLSSFDDQPTLADLGGVSEDDRVFSPPARDHAAQLAHELESDEWDPENWSADEMAANEAAAAGSDFEEQLAADVAAAQVSQTDPLYLRSSLISETRPDYPVRPENLHQTVAAKIHQAADNAKQQAVSGAKSRLQDLTSTISEADPLQVEVPAPRSRITLKAGMGLLALLVIIAIGGVAWQQLSTPAAISQPASTAPSASKAPRVPGTTAPSADGATPPDPGANADKSEMAAGPHAPSMIIVSVVGAVEHPGLVTLAPGARLADAITQSHPLGDADLVAIPLAQKVTDGQHIVVPRTGEIPPPFPGAAPAPGSPAAGGGAVNINTASQEELESLPGIGPKTAAAIISERNQRGKFTQLEDLTVVKGIGPASIEKLKGKAVAN